MAVTILGYIYICMKIKEKRSKLKKSFLDFFCTKYFIVYSKNVKVKADLMDSLLTSFLNDFNPL